MPSLFFLFPFNSTFFSFSPLFFKPWCGACVYVCLCVCACNAKKGARDGFSKRSKSVG